MKAESNFMPLRENFSTFPKSIRHVMNFPIVTHVDLCMLMCDYMHEARVRFDNTTTDAEDKDQRL